MIDDDTAQTAGDDRREDGSPWPVDLIPDGRGPRAAHTVPANPDGHRSDAPGQHDAEDRRPCWIDFDVSGRRASASAFTDRFPGGLGIIGLPEIAPVRVTALPPLRNGQIAK